jgi:NAD(P)-dependent dehydrogenase (short-subunit alcohol dehydrogenase family)
MRAAGQGRIVVVSSESGLRGMPGISSYGASKGALERWSESLAGEIAPFGLGVTVLVTGTFKTDILEQTHNWKDPEGPYARLHEQLESKQDLVLRLAPSPDSFAPAVERALHEHKPFERHAVGLDAKAMLYGGKVMPGRLMAWIATRALGLPRPGSLRLTPTSRLAVTPQDDVRP